MFMLHETGHFCITSMTGDCRRDDNKNGTGANQCEVNKYLKSGFAYLQKIIDQALMEVYIYV